MESFEQEGHRFRDLEEREGRMSKFSRSDQSVVPHRRYDHNDDDDDYDANASDNNAHPLRVTTMVPPAHAVITTDHSNNGIRSSRNGSRKNPSAQHLKRQTAAMLRPCSQQASGVRCPATAYRNYVSSRADTSIIVRRLLRHHCRRVEKHEAMEERRPRPLRVHLPHHY
ncbi:hypothetical protein BKA70DRAFT_1424184 [Coprinopsis sp. MPI-PUGE-AT-0042]|nr:hypothetical protein BKA70DRAFT_1424184 [Coprinopsis sp. MPI-PUGE-AT-0042]